jgi:hypothetical protein
VTVNAVLLVIKAFVVSIGTKFGNQLMAVFQSPPDLLVQTVCACVVTKLAASNPAQKHIVLKIFVACIMLWLLFFYFFTLIADEWIG